jgi:N-acetylglucosaminyldiphosphoundecaprenol N-acetyl-beta-D-mannosaminyltransferase
MGFSPEAARKGYAMNSNAAGNPAPAAPVVNILDFPVANLDMKEAVAAAAAMLGQGNRARIVTANAEIMYTSHKNRELGSLLRSAGLIVPDGTGVVKAAAMLGRPLKARVAGVDLMGELAEWAAANHRSVYLLGAAKEAVEGTAAALRAKYPALKIAGWHDGYFTAEEESRILREIQEKQPDFLFIAMGFPAEHLFFVKHREQLPVGVMMGVGGSFDALSGRVRRAPAWIRRMNLEWVYRFAQNPRRLKRFGALPGFMLAVRRQAKKEKAAARN